MHRIRQIVAAVALLCGAMIGISAGESPPPRATNCQTTGATRTAFPSVGTWVVVNQQTFNVSSLPARWDPFSGYLDGARAAPTTATGSRHC